MGWTRKDWNDLLLMTAGACVGMIIFFFGVAPLIDFDFNSKNPLNYVLAASIGSISGYALRFGVHVFRADPHV